MLAVRWLNNDGGGYVETVNVVVGTTVEELRVRKLSEDDADSYTIQVNHEPVSADYMLKANDLVTVTMKNYQGA
jgi:ribosomal 50S subunit-recycling heat shock protein